MEKEIKTHHAASTNQKIQLAFEVKGVSSFE